jgi:hypothetical protein
VIELFLSHNGLQDSAAYECRHPYWCIVQNVDPDLMDTTFADKQTDSDTEAQSSKARSGPPTRGCRTSACLVSKFLLPTRNDPDEQRRVMSAKRLGRQSPYAAHVHVAFAQLAVFWNRALFPRISRTSLVSNDKRRKQISLCEQRLMAVCVMQHGRNYEVCFIFVRAASFVSSVYWSVSSLSAVGNVT